MQIEADIHRQCFFAHFFATAFFLGANALTGALAAPVAPESHKDCSEWADNERRENSATLKEDTATCGPGLLSERFTSCWQSAHDRSKARTIEISNEYRACIAAVEKRKLEERREKADKIIRDMRAEERRIEQRFSTVPMSRAQAQASLAVGMMSLLMQQSYRKRVEKGFGKGVEIAETKLIEENNRRSKMAFDQLRTAMKSHWLVRGIQDELFRQLDNQLKVTSEQMGNLDGLVAQVLADIPSRSQIMASPNIQRREGAVRYLGIALDYEGQVDAAGQPHGIGFARGKQGGEGSGIFFGGRFENGTMTGPGRLLVGNDEGYWMWEGKLDNSRPVPPGVRTIRVTETGVQINRSIAKLGHNVLEILYQNGTRYRGQAQGFEPNGFGYLISADQKVWTGGKFVGGRLASGPAIMESGDLWCTAVNEMHQCNGLARKDLGDGAYRVGTQVNGHWSKDFVYEARSADGLWAIGQGDMTNNIGRMDWSNGSSFDGLWNGGRFVSGRLRAANGSIFEGEFENDELRDGVITWYDGSREIRGRGLRAPVPTYGAAQR